MKKKILIFNGFYYPSKNCGGPVTSIANTVEACSDEFDFYIVAYNHDLNDSNEFNVEINKWIQVGKANVMYVEDGYFDYSLKRMSIFLKDLHPDLIWFSGIFRPNNRIVAVINAKKQKIPVLFSPRGEVSADRVRIKKYKKAPYLFLLKILKLYNNCYFHATSNDEEEGIKKYFRPDNNHIYKVANIAILKQKQLKGFVKKENSLNMLFFSRIHEVKNLLFGIECLKKCQKNINFDIYGPIESEDYWHQCEDVITTLPNNIKVNYKGIIEKDRMSEIIQKYDCMLFPTINENYGHVIAETLANGRPIILSKGTTPWDDLDQKAGYVISLSNQNGFTEIIDLLAEKNESQYGKIIKNVETYFDEKINKNGAIEGHKKMFNTIINFNNKNRIK